MIETITKLCDSTIRKNIRIPKLGNENAKWYDNIIAYAEESRWLYKSGFMIMDK